MIYLILFAIIDTVIPVPITTIILIFAVLKYPSAINRCLEDMGWIGDIDRK